MLLFLWDNAPRALEHISSSSDTPSKISTNIEEIEATHIICFQPPDVLKRLLVHLGVFYQYVYYQFMLIVLSSKIGCLIVITALSTHGDCGVQIELEVTR